MAVSSGFVIFVVVAMVMSSAVLPANGRRRCSKLTRVVERVPVHARFDIDKFIGTWYTIKQASEDLDDDVTFESAVMDFSKNSDGSLSYVVTGKVEDDPACLPAESGSMRRKKRLGHYVMQGTSMTEDDPTFIVSFTNYNTALVYYCLRYHKSRLGQCQKGASHVEIISRTPNPPEAELADYVRRMQRRLCAKSAAIRDTSPGECEIPDILAAAKLESVDSDENDGSEHTNSSCAVNSVNVQQTFSMAQMDGIWYEIARTRMTFNTMESVISAHKYVAAQNEIYSYYTGTLNDTCRTAIQGMSKRRSDDLSEGDMLGRIGGAESIYPWVPMKVLYADDNYLLFYACYYGELNSTCPRQAVEVTLVGRSREIDPDLEQSIYANLYDVCLQPSLMVRTEFEANCSKWVEAEIRNAGLHPRDCPIDLISNRTDFDIFDNDQMLGEWLGYSGKNYGPTGTLMGAVMNISMLPNDALVANVVGYNSGTSANCSRQTDMIMRERCLYLGEFVISTEDGTLAFGSVPYIDDNTLLLYTCSDRNIHGTCEPTGVSVYVFTRNGTLGDDVSEHLDDVLRASCINPTDLVRLDSDSCSLLDATPSDFTGNDSCDVDNVVLYNDLDDLQHLQLRGYWYLYGELRDTEGVEAQVGYITTDEQHVLQIFTTGYNKTSENGTCLPVSHMFATPRCKASVDGDYVARRVGNESTGYTPYKVIYTDYNSMLMTYSCMEVLPGGACRPGEDNVQIWSRKSKLKKKDVYYVTSWLEDYCLSSKRIRKSNHKQFSCLDTLTGYVEENEISFDEEEYDEEDDFDVDFDDFDYDEEYE